MQPREEREIFHWNEVLVFLHQRKKKEFERDFSLTTKTGTSKFLFQVPFRVLIPKIVYIEGKLKSRPTVTRLSLGCLILVRSLI